MPVPVPSFLRPLTFLSGNFTMSTGAKSCPWPVTLQSLPPPCASLPSPHQDLSCFPGAACNYLTSEAFIFKVAWKVLPAPVTPFLFCRVSYSLLYNKSSRNLQLNTAIVLLPDLGLSWGQSLSDGFTHTPGASVLALGWDAWHTSPVCLCISYYALSSSTFFIWWLASSPPKTWTGIATVSFLVHSLGRSKSQSQLRYKGRENRLYCSVGGATGTQWDGRNC